MRNKSLALLMCATMACTTVPVDLAGNTAINVKTVKAAEVTSGDYTYDTNGVDTITITKYTGNKSSLVIPTTIDGYTVTKIKNSVFCNNENLQSVEIPDEVTEIGDYAFSNCSNLEEVKLPAKLKSLGFQAFSKCTALSNITIPKTLEAVSSPFEDCDHLYTAVIEDGAEKVCGGLFTRSGVQKVTIPETVKKIEKGAFWGCSNLQSIEIPDNVTEIEDYAFIGCTNLEEVKIPMKLKSLGFGAFNNCSSLENIYFYGNAPEFASYVFSDVTATVYTPEGDTT